MPQVYHSFANGKGSAMVREFFGSIARFLFIIMLFIVMGWGIIQFVENIPNEKNINSVVLFVLSLCLLLHGRPLVEDLHYYFRQAIRSMSHDERQGKE